MVNMINDVELWNQVTPELQNGEELLWVGKPTPLRVVLANGELIAGLFSVALLIFVFVMFSNFRMPSFQSPAGSSFSPFSLFNWFPLFFAAIALFTVGRPLYEFFMATRTIYGLTDKRALIIKHSLSGKSVESYTEIDQLERTSLDNGKGDLVFARLSTRYRRKGGYRTRTRKIGFFGIDNVREVEALMLRSLKEKESAF